MNLTMPIFSSVSSLLKRWMPPLLALLIVACASVQPAPDPNDLIDASEYDRLKLVSTQPGVKIYRFISPDYKRTDYRAIMVDPIVLYQSAEKDLGKTGISEETIYKIRNAMDISMRQMVRKQFGMSYKPGRRVARLSTAVTGVIIDGDAFRPKRLVPISTVLKSAGQLTTIAGGRPQLMVEAKLIDSVTGKLLGDGVYLVSSEQFRLEVDSPEKFQVLASQWVRQAVSVATGLR
jgi:Protein of unknown function (DUF3313)